MMIVALNPKNAKEKQRQELRAKLYKQEVGRDAPDRKRSLLNWLLHDVFTDLLLRIIFAVFITGIFVLSLKQWQSRPETQPPASSAPKTKTVELAPAVQPKPAPVAPPVPPNACPQGSIKIGQYINHCNGTVTDTESDLMWKRCPEGLSGVNCKHGETKVYTWNDAVRRFNNVEYAGYSDWRMPTLAELKTLVQCSKGVKDKDDGLCNDGSETPAINQQAFPNTEAGWFWSGSPYAGDAWRINFSHGYSFASNRTNDCMVRLVRGGQ